MSGILVATTVHVTVNLPNEEFEEDYENITSLDELEEKLTNEYPSVTSFVFAWAI